MVSKQQVALVTGAARGIGAATARRLAREGYAVAVNDVAFEEQLQELAQEIGGLSVPGDISTADGIAATVAAELGPVTALVANAAFMEMQPFLEQEPGRWWRHIDVNLSGHFRLIQRVIPAMRDASFGRIVIITSGWGVTGYPGASAYAASKAGLIALAKGLGRELAPFGICTNAIAPAYVDTEQLAVDAADAGIPLAAMRERYRALIPIGELASPADIAATVAFLCGEAGGAFVGQVLQPSGGVARSRA